MEQFIFAIVYMIKAFKQIRLKHKHESKLTNALHHKFKPSQFTCFDMTNIFLEGEKGCLSLSKKPEKRPAACRRNQQDAPELVEEPEKGVFDKLRHQQDVIKVPYNVIICFNHIAKKQL